VGGGVGMKVGREEEEEEEDEEDEAAPMIISRIELMERSSFDLCMTQEQKKKQESSAELSERERGVILFKSF
jgi:hypothetical protein